MQQNPTGRNLTLSVGTVLDTADYNNFVNHTYTIKEIQYSR